VPSPNRIRTELEVEVFGPETRPLLAGEMYRSPDYVATCARCERKRLKRELQTTRASGSLPVCIDSEGCSRAWAEPCESRAVEQAEEEDRAMTRDWEEEQAS